MKTNNKEQAAQYDDGEKSNVKRKRISENEAVEKCGKIAIKARFSSCSFIH
jgi:hypothetical protein